MRVETIPLYMLVELVELVVARRDGSAVTRVQGLLP